MFSKGKTATWGAIAHERWGTQTKDNNWGLRLKGQGIQENDCVKNKERKNEKRCIARMSKTAWEQLKNIIQLYRKNRCK